MCFELLGGRLARTPGIVGWAVGWLQPCLVCYVLGWLKELFCIWPSKKRPKRRFTGNELNRESDAFSHCHFGVVWCSVYLKNRHREPTARPMAFGNCTAWTLVGSDEMCITACGLRKTTTTTRRAGTTKQQLKEHKQEQEQEQEQKQEQERRRRRRRQQQQQQQQQQLKQQHE